MPISFSIHPDRGLAVIVYEGFIEPNDREAAFRAFVKHRSYRPGQKRLIDLSRVTGWDKTLERTILETQQQTAWLLRQDHQTLSIYYAPTLQSRELAEILVKCWDDVPNVVPLILEDEAEALAILGQSELRVSDLSAAA